MLQCTANQITNPSQCTVYSYSNYLCSRYIRNTYVLNRYNEDGELFVEINESIDDASHIFSNLMVRHKHCSTLFMILLCNTVFPKCIPASGRTQKLCRETCQHFMASCKFVLPFWSRYLKNEKWRLGRNVTNLMHVFFNCDLYPSVMEQYDPQCLAVRDLKATRNERCHGRLDAYVGNVSWTISNETCHKWSDTCSDTTLIDLNNMDGINTNYCRNPNGYRKTPWCYTDRTTKNWEYCNIPHCPGVDGNYGDWSTFTNCSCINATRYRSRQCDNPTPRYLGKNCSHLGPSIEVDEVTCGSICHLALTNNRLDEEEDYLYILIPLLVVVLVVLGGIVFFIQRRQEKEYIEPYIDVALSPEKITDLMTFSRTDDEEEMIKSIKHHIWKFSHCLCSTCISTWLFKLIKDSGYKENEQIIDDIRLMLSDLESIDEYKNLSQTCHREHDDKEDNPVPQLQNELEETNCERLCSMTNNEKDELLASAVDKWVTNQLVYDKLNPCTRTTEPPSCGVNQPTPRMLFGSFEISGSKIVPIYDKLKKFRGNDTDTDDDHTFALVPSPLVYESISIDIPPNGQVVA